MDTTRELIRQVQQGSRDAADQLYRRYCLRVLFRVRVELGRRLRLKEESGDILQIALMRSLKALAGFRYTSEGAFLGFLVTEVRRVIGDEHDRFRPGGKRDPQREVPFKEDRSSGPGTPLPERGGDCLGPLEILERNEAMQRLGLALDQLRQEKLEYWQLIVAIDLDGRKHAEIAAEQGTTEDAVKQKHYRARAALARIYRKLGGTSSDAKGA